MAQSIERWTIQGKRIKNDLLSPGNLDGDGFVSGRLKLYFQDLKVLVGLFTPPRNRGGVIFSLQFVCVCVCVSGTSCEQNSSRTNEPISDPIDFGDLGSKVKVTVT